MHIIRFAVVAIVLGSTLYWVLLGVVHRPLVAWLYAGRYTEHADLLWLLGLLPIFLGAGTILGVALRALERPDLTLRANAFCAVLTLTAGIGFLIRWGLVGAVWGILASGLAFTAAMIWLFVGLRRARGKKRAGEDAKPV